MTLSTWRQRLDSVLSLDVDVSEELLKRLLVVLTVCWLLLGVILPLFPLILRSLSDQNGNWVGLANYWRYFNTPALSISFFNSLKVSLVTTILAVTLAFGYAYALTRTQMPSACFW
jgi:iron(III) transport system permease protein